jgi:hypothetical protein
MDKLTHYRQAIRQLLTEYAAVPISYGQIETQVMFDVEHDHYQVMNVGWDGARRVYGCILHLDIKDQKIWVQHNSTELRVGNELLSLGVPKDDIVLGFQAPELRQYTEFGVA